MDLSILELGVEGKDLRVVIIGNGVVVQDYRQFVDDADCVIRFNLFDLGTVKQEVAPMYSSIPIPVARPETVR